MFTNFSSVLAKVCLSFAIVLTIAACQEVTSGSNVVSLTTDNHPFSFSDSCQDAEVLNKANNTCYGVDKYFAANTTEATNSLAASSGCSHDPFVRDNCCCKNLFGSCAPQCSYHWCKTLVCKTSST